MVDSRLAFAIDRGCPFAVYTPRPAGAVVHDPGLFIHANQNLLRTRSPKASVPIATGMIILYMAAMAFFM